MGTGPPGLVVTGPGRLALAAERGRSACMAPVHHPHRLHRLGRGSRSLVIPVHDPDEMAQVDRQAAEPVEVLIERAGYEVARVARAMLGGGYGRRVVVVAGRGNNGYDGRAAARVLARWGVAVSVLDASEVAGGEGLGEVDLVIDAAYGTGLSRPYPPPDAGLVPVLAVDIPSGLSGLTGLPVGASPAGAGRAVRAVRTTVIVRRLQAGSPARRWPGPHRAGRGGRHRSRPAGEARRVHLADHRRGRTEAVGRPGPPRSQVAERGPSGGGVRGDVRGPVARRPGGDAGRRRLRPRRGARRAEWGGLAAG